MKEEWKKLFHIFWAFLKISPVTFGGGYAMIPLIEKEIVEKRKWLKKEEVTDVLALSQSVPGAVAVNSATFIGQRVGGVKGLIAAALGVSLPTFGIILALGILYIFIQDNPKVEAAFMAIRASVVALILYAAIKVSRTALLDKTTIAIFIVGVPLLFLFHPILIILLGGIIGIAVVSIKKRLGYTVTFEKEEEDEEDKYWHYMI